MDAVVHVVAAVVALATAAWTSLSAERGRTDVTYLRRAACGTVVWTSCVASVKAEGIHDWHQILWFPSIAFTAGAIVMWAGTFAHYSWAPPRRLVALWLGAPALILAVRLAWGHSARFPLFVANTVYCFGALVIAAMWISQRARDVSVTVRLLSRGFVVVSVGVLIAEAFRANITDLIATVTIVSLTATILIGGEQLHGRPSADALIDDLGALMFVFDQDQRLVDSNAPARHFYSLRDVVPPRPGAAARDIVGRDLAELDAVFVELAAGSSRVAFSGYVQRLPSHGSPPRGWVCLLRRSAGPASADEAREARKTLMNRLPTSER